MYTSGALILSNDGDFIYQVTHPKHEINKTYQVTVKGKITNEEVENLRNGVDIGDYITKPAQVRIMKVDEEKNISRIEITIHEGKNRQVRRMCEAINIILTKFKICVNILTVVDTGCMNNYIANYYAYTYWLCLIKFFNLY